MEGVIGIVPKIKKLDFKRGRLVVNLEDGREVSVPLRHFPSIKKLSLLQRKRWRIMGDVMFSFEDCNEVFHVEQVLGKEEDYKYRF